MNTDPAHGIRRRVVVVTFDDAQLLDIAGPLDVFAGANRYCNASYDIDIVSVNGTPIRTTSGLTIHTDPIADIAGPIDTVIVAGGDAGAIGSAQVDNDLIRHIARLAGNARRVASVCTGAFLLAETGLLDGRRAVTHWRAGNRLATQYPAITVEADPIYVHDRDIWTSAGVTSGIDLALALVADDHGPATAATVARFLVVYLRRFGGQAHVFGPPTDTVSEPLLKELLGWIVDNMERATTHPDNEWVTDS